jgi:hypothetical protein
MKMKFLSMVSAHPALFTIPIWGFIAVETSLTIKPLLIASAWGLTEDDFGL